VVSALAVVVAVFGPLVYGLAFVRGAREATHVRPVAPCPLDRDLLVVIPARNEARRLPPTLRALLADPSPHLRVVVVDDGSDDGTARLARQIVDERLIVVDGPGPPPPGTFGKPRALAFGAAAVVHGDVILALDADVLVRPGLLGGLVAALLDAQAAAVSGLPDLDNVTAIEQALVPGFVAAVAATHPPSAVHDDATATAFLNGQLLLVRRDALDDVGGFFAVQDTVLEDVALARKLKARGHRVRVVDVRGLASTRMYETLSGIVHGFAKNARALHGDRLVPLAALLVVGSLAPALALGLACMTDVVFDEVVAAVGVAVSVGLAAANRRRLGSGAAWGLASPAVQLVVAATYLWAAVRRRGRWRGREFST
jgi:cellulose synthase/poly-beta-1,6-N-acetylglucosamine synthase-like glycosyltransferase